MSNESKWGTLIGGIIAAIVPLLVAYGVVSAEQGAMWQSLAVAVVGLVIAVVVPVTVTSLAKNYNDNDTVSRVALMENETARIMASK